MPRIKNCIKGARLIHATQIRIDNKEIADNHHLYSVRHSDYDMSNPLTIEKIVIVNHFCDIILDKPLRHLENTTDDRYLDLNDVEKEVIRQAIEEDESLGRPF